MKKRRIISLGIIIMAVLLFGGFFDCKAAEDGEDDDYGDYLLDESWADFLENDTFSFSQLTDDGPQQLLQRLGQTFVQKLVGPFKITAGIMAALVLTLFLKLLCAGEMSSELNDTVQSAVTASIFLVLCRPFLQVLEEVQLLLENCRLLLSQFIPILGSVMAAGGQSATAVICTTAFFSIATVASQVLSQFVPPLVRIFLALNITQGLSGSLRLNGLVQLLKKTVTWTMGLLSTLLCAFLGLQGMLANSADSLALRAGKFAVAGGIPIVGGAVSEAVGTVYSGLKLVKGAVGSIGLILLVLMFAPILIQCILYHLACGVCAAGAELVQNERARGVLAGIGDSIQVLTAILSMYLILLILSSAWMILFNAGGG